MKIPTGEAVKIARFRDDDPEFDYFEVYIGAIGEVVPLERAHKEIGYDYSVRLVVEDSLEECIGFYEDELEVYNEPTC